MSQGKPIDVHLKPAGGGDALKSVWLALREHQVVMKGAGTLLRANQPAGFDGPGCALARPQRAPDFRVLRERGQGGRQRGDPQARHPRALCATHGDR